jgi:hypothetical protein
MSSLYIELEPAAVLGVEAERDTLQQIFDLCIPRKDLAKPDSQISNKYFAKNNYNILSGILCNENASGIHHFLFYVSSGNLSAYEGCPGAYRWNEYDPGPQNL